MKKKHFIFLILVIPVLSFALSGCKGGSSKPPSQASSSAASPTAVKAASAFSLSPGLWKMTVSSTTQMPSMAGRPPMDHTSVTTHTVCIKPDSKQSKSFVSEPKNFKCDKIKERIGAGGTIHWAMRCKNSHMTLSTKGKSKITAKSLISHAVTKTTDPSGFSMNIMMDTTGKLISNQCQSK